jgi:hypothetical protein
MANGFAWTKLTVAVGGGVCGVETASIHGPWSWSSAVVDSGTADWSEVFVFHLCVHDQHGDDARRCCQEPERRVGARGSKTARNDDPGGTGPPPRCHVVALVLLLRPVARDELQLGTASFLDSGEAGSPRRLLPRQWRAREL